MKEDAKDPSYFNFFLRAWQKLQLWCLVVGWVATGCILMVQADMTMELISVLSEERPVPWGEQ